MTMPAGSAGTEDLDTDMWVEYRLMNATTLNGPSPGLALNSRIYHGLAPSDTEFPYVVYKMQSGIDAHVFGAPASRLAVDFVYMVTVLSATADMSHFKPMLDLIDRIMEIKNDTVIRTLEDGSVWRTVFTSTSAGPISFSENHSGKVVWHKGRSWKITTQSFMVSDATNNPLAGVSDGTVPTIQP